MIRSDETPAAGCGAPIDRYECRSFLAGADSALRYDICLALAVDRLQRKERNLRDMFEAAGRNWEQTAYQQLMRATGDMNNRGNYLEVARRATYERIRREGPAVPVIEAMLFGTAGLLDSCRDDAYTAELKSTFDHLRHKYGIEPLPADSWKIRNTMPASHPRLRLAQIAALLSRTNYLIDTIVSCRTTDDILRVFCADASQYWSSYYNPSTAVNHSTKRIGEQKAALIGINLVAALQIFYGNRHGREELRPRALHLWEELPPERNQVLRFWISGGICPVNALESQALLQLTLEYCGRKRCARCPLNTQRSAAK